MSHNPNETKKEDASQEDVETNGVVASQSSSETNKKAASHASNETNAEVASQEDAETNRAYASHACDETNVEHASHVGDETNYKPASHPPCETNRAYASHSSYETNDFVASQPSSETKKKNASQKRSETNSKFASHASNETNAEVASHASNETNAEVASHSSRETNGLAASHDVGETNRANASHACDETNVEHASQVVDETKQTFANNSNNSQFPSVLTFLMNTFYDYQKTRIATANRHQFIDVPPDTQAFFKELQEQAHNFEKRIEQEIKKTLAGNTLYEKYLARIKGIGPVMGGGLIAYLALPRVVKQYSHKHVETNWDYASRCENETKKADASQEANKTKTRLTPAYITLPPVMQLAKNPSSLFSYCGFAPGSRRKKGEPVKYNPDLKMFLWKVGMQLLKAKGVYYRLYLQEKEIYEKKCQQVEKGSRKLKIHYTAMRIVLRHLLFGLWKRYREENNLPLSNPYPCDILGHALDPDLMDELPNPKR